MKKTKINLYSDISGNNVAINAYSYGVTKKGIYIQGGVHGGELTYFIFERLSKWLSQNEKHLNNSVTLVPIVNPPAWNQRVYYYTVGKFDLYKGKDWNRSYTSNPSTTLSASNSSKVLNFAKKFKLVIDLHTARNSKPYTIYDNPKLTSYIKDFGIKYNILLDSQDPSNSTFSGAINFALGKLNVPSFVCECGEHDSFNEENIAIVTDGLKRLITKYCMEKKVESSKVPQFSINKVKTIFSTTSGFAVYNVKPQESFKKGDTLCTLFKSENLGDVENIKADFNGTMFEIPRTNIVWKGDELLKVVQNEAISKI